MPLSARLPLAILAAAWTVIVPAAAQTNTPESTGAITVPHFSVDRYMGRWHEVARLDHPFERNLTRVTSERQQRPDGTIDVTNRGFDTTTQQWREVRATAQMETSAERPTLKIRYGDREHVYEVLEMAEDNSHALIGSTDKAALWIFARQPTLDESTVERLKARALSLGFQTGSLMRVEQAPQ